MSTFDVPPTILFPKSNWKHTTVLWLSKLLLLVLTCDGRPAVGDRVPFPPVKVINLARHTHRRDHVVNELTSKKIKFSFIDAVDGRDLSDRDLNDKTSKLGKWFMTPGMIGCFYSHRRCWEECVRLNKMMIVFEDDVTLVPNFKEIVQSTLKQLRSLNDSDGNVRKWDVLLLGALGCVHPKISKYSVNIIASTVGGKWRTPQHVASLGNKKLDKDKESIRFSVHVPLCPYGMHAYIISPRGAKKLLEKQCIQKASFHVDVVAWGVKELDILALHPLIAWQTNADTTIGGLLHVWKRIFPTWVGDSYTGFEMGWALSAPLLRVGGPNLFGGKLLLTNGMALAFMFAGLILAWILKSAVLLQVTLVFVLAVTAVIRKLSSSSPK